MKHVAPSSTIAATCERASMFEHVSCSLQHESCTHRCVCPQRGWCEPAGIYADNFRGGFVCMRVTSQIQTVCLGVEAMDTGVCVCLGVEAMDTGVCVCVCLGVEAMDTGVRVCVCT